MKRTALLLFAVLFTLPGLAQADSAYGSLQAVHEKKHRIKGLTQNLYPTRVAVG